MCTAGENFRKVYYIFYLLTAVKRQFIVLFVHLTPHPPGGKKMHMYDFKA